MMQCVLAFRAGSFGAGLGEFLWGLLYVVSGGLMVARPMVGLAVLTLVVAGFFFLMGAWKSMLALRLKPRQGWGWVLLGGGVSLLLGVLLLARWPWSGEYAIGVLVGVELLFDGWAYVAFGSALNQVARSPAAP
jgi:uncharacterized membrane protein HdeD (DUF308 family)